MIADPVPDDVETTLSAYAEAVRTSPHNLLSERALAELESRHIAESRAFSATLPRSVDLLDVGTGGGLPGLVIAITRPDIRVTVLDATKKKTAFVEQVARDLAIPVRTLNGRAEDLQEDFGGQFDVVTARAVAPLKRLLGWTLPFLRPGGSLHAIKGARWREELQAAMPTLQHHHAAVAQVPGMSTANPDSSDAAAPRVVIIRMAG